MNGLQNYVLVFQIPMKMQCGRLAKNKFGMKFGMNVKLLLELGNK